MPTGTTTSTDSSGIAFLKQTAGANGTVQNAAIPELNPPNDEAAFKNPVNTDANRLQILRILSESLISDRSKQAPQEINGLRRDVDLVTTGVQAQGDIRFAFSATTFDEMILSALAVDKTAGTWNLQNIATNGALSDGGGGSLLISATDIETGFALNDVVQFEGGLAATVTGTFEVTALPAAGQITLTPIYQPLGGLSYETESNALNRRLKLTKVGARAVIDVSNGTADGAATFTVDGTSPDAVPFANYVVGDVIRVTDVADSETGFDETTTAGASGAAERFLRITAKTPTGNAVDVQALAAKDGTLPDFSGNATDLEVRIEGGLQMRDGRTLDAYTIVRLIQQSGSNPALYDVFTGMVPNTFSLSLTGQDFIQGTMGLLGRIGVATDFSQGGIGFGATSAPGLHPASSTSVDNAVRNLRFLRLASNQSSASIESRCFKTFTLNTSNNAEASGCLGELGAAAIVARSFTATGTASLVVSGSSVTEGNLIQSTYDEDGSLALLGLMQTREGHYYMIDMPEMTFETAPRPIQGKNQEFTMEFNYRGILKTSGYGRTVGFYRFLR